MKRMQERLIGLAIVLGCASGCEQPKVDCTTGHGGFAAKYTLKPGSKQGTGTCDELAGEIIGLEKYNPSQAGDPKKQDLTKARLRIRSSTLGELALAAEEAGISIDPKTVSSLGDFVSAESNDNNVCLVPSLSEAAVALPASDTSSAANIKYAWSNVRIYVSTAAPGTQMAGDLVYTDGDCSASYSVVGLWPAVSCEVTDAEGEGTGVPDPALCNPAADPAAGRVTGSGINPDFKDRLTCDPKLLLCVLSEAPEELR